jgi:methylphosphotriester-DNA--protein-cysteine methyltransferase
MKSIKVKVFGVAFILLLMLASAALGGEFWGSLKSDKYHYPDCRWAQKIHAVNLIVFNSPSEAHEAGYVPCKVCSPPLPEKAK